ncbi:MAG TPA: HipA domain-containing protein [Solirubrobacterales bacterium]|nr:HipA domain-containing protein [Solirubrobacterales bacterium]
MSETAEVRLWGRTIGAVSLEPGERTAVFQYVPEFVPSGIQVAPLTMPLRSEPYSFPELSYRSFKGLPGMLADSLPDRYGNALIDAWLARQGRDAESASAVERLCYLGQRAGGALEYAPVRGPEPSVDEDIQVGELVALASRILAERDGFETTLAAGEEEAGLLEILSVGMSAGGARAKAMIAWNPVTKRVRSGQVEAGPGFEHWLLKFDGVRANRDKERFDDPEGYGAIEFAYSQMAAAAGVEMAACRLFEENGRRHFMTRRFDRPTGSTKLHMQSLGAMRHFDFNQAGAYSYEQALMTIRKLGLPMAVVEQQFRRMAFNVIGRNQDDHVKNIAFLMDQAGEWSLSPAFDVTYNYRRDGEWTASHQMSLNGKRDGFELDDFVQCAEVVSMQRRRALAIVDEVAGAIADWPAHAAGAKVPESRAVEIGDTFRLELRPGRRSR